MANFIIELSKDDVEKALSDWARLNYPPEKIKRDSVRVTFIDHCWSCCTCQPENENPVSARVTFEGVVNL